MTRSSERGQQYVAARVGFVDVDDEQPALPAWLDEGQQHKHRQLSVGQLSPPRLPTALGSTLRFDEPAADSDLDAGSEQLSEAFQALEQGRRVPPAGAVGNRASPSLQVEQAAVEAARAEYRPTDTMVDDLLHKGDQEALRQLSEAIQGFWQTRSQLIERSETQLVELVSTICRRVLIREVSIDPNVVQGLVRQGLAALGEADQVVVRLGPYFGEVAESLRDSLQASGIRAQVIVDDLAKSYACSLETELGYVDESVEARLQALIEDATYSQVSGSRSGKR